MTDFAPVIFLFVRTLRSNLTDRVLF